MNLSFIVLGLTILVGAYYFWKSLSKDNYISYGLMALALSGAGSILVGLFPENTVHVGHLLGAGLSFIFGNIGIILTSLSKTNGFTKIFRILSVLLGSIALVATFLIATNNYLYLGIGGIERIAAYTQTIWMIIFGSLHIKSKD